MRILKVLVAAGLLAAVAGCAYYGPAYRPYHPYYYYRY